MRPRRGDDGRMPRGLRRRDVIVKVGDEDLAGLSDFIKLYDRLIEQNLDKIFLTLKRNGATRFVVLPANRPEGGFLDEQ